MGVWSDDDEICCIHPGGARLVGAAAIRASFEAMFGNGAIDAEPHRVRRLESHSSAVHSVIERIRVDDAEGEQFAWVVATNVYLKSSQGWRLVAHHASPGTSVEAPDDARRPRRRCTDGRRAALPMNDFRAPRWLPGGHVQTIWPVLFSRRFDGAAPVFRRERWDDARRRLHRRRLREGATGTRRCSCSSTASRARRRATTRRPSPPRRGGAAGASRCRTFAAARARSTCAPRAYHSGDHEEVGWMLARLRALHAGPLVAVGVSLGGNALAALGRGSGRRARPSACARSPRSRAPLDLAAGGRAIGRGFGRQVYTRMFMRTMKPKALVKLAQHPGLFDASGDARGARPARVRRRLHRRRCTASPTPTTTTRALGEAAPGPHPHPGAGAQRAQRSVPAGVGAAARTGEVGPCVTLWQPAHGGHVGFADGAGPGHLRTLPDSGRRLARRPPRAPPARKIGAWTRSSRPRCKKWPNVPHCYGWLALDARGDWYMRDDRIQARGPVPARQGQPHRPRQAARVHRTATTTHDDSGAGSSRTARSASTSSSRRRPGSGACRPTRRRASSSPATPGCRRCRRDASSTSRGGSSSPATSASASSTRSTWTSPATRVERGVWRPQDAAFEALRRRASAIA